MLRRRARRRLSVSIPSTCICIMSLTGFFCCRALGEDGYSVQPRRNPSCASTFKRPSGSPELSQMAQIEHPRGHVYPSVHRQLHQCLDRKCTAYLRVDGNLRLPSDSVPATDTVACCKPHHAGCVQLVVGAAGKHLRSPTDHLDQSSAPRLLQRVGGIVDFVRQPPCCATFHGYWRRFV